MFTQGAATNSKLSAEQMYEKMKNSKISGNYFFQPHEYLQVKQIRNLVSRIKKKCDKKHQIHMSEDDGIETNLEEICESELYSDNEEFEGFDGVEDSQYI